jgi:hypothetical protein
MNIVGKVVEVHPTKVVNEKFKTREIWIETDGQYPQTIALQLTQDKCDKFNLSVGSQGTFEINLRGRKWTNPQGQTVVFNTIECWAWAGQATEQPQAQAPSGGLTVADVENDDLPF